MIGTLAYISKHIIGFQAVDVSSKHDEKIDRKLIIRKNINDFSFHGYTNIEI